MTAELAFDTYLIMTPSLRAASESRTLVEGALAKDPAAVRRFVDRFTPIVQARVTRALRRRIGLAQGRRIEQEVDDMVQEVFISLFHRNGRVLRSWDPDRGLSLDNFVGLVAEREAGAILRSGKRSPWTEDPTEAPDLDATAVHGDRATAPIHDKLYLQRILDRMRTKLSVKGLQIFEILYVQQTPVAEAATLLNSTPDALYKWRTRLMNLARQVAEELAAKEKLTS